MSPIFRPVSPVLFLLLATIFAGACSDNPVPVTNDDHFEAKGLVLVRQGIDSIFVENAQVRGALQVRKNDSTGYFDVFFLREDTGARDLPTSDEYSLGWTIGDSTVVAVEAPPSDGHGHAHYEFRLRGLKADTTSISIRLLHNGHPDFASPPIPVTVTE